jgi:2,3-dihydroxyphenylpropionate 1,2-dioxygenase
MDFLAGKAPASIDEGAPMATHFQADASRRGAVVGAAIVPHAPQFLTLPETEDRAQVGRVHAAMRELGDRFRALDPDLVIVISNAHCDDFVVRCVPAFMVHCGGRAQGSGGHAGWWPIDGAAGDALVRELLDLGFDPAFTLDAALGTAFTIPLDFCGFPREAPFLPVFVNAYVPPQPTPERCFAFGRALGLALERIGRRAVILASGGLSHYPGTPLYPHPDLATDRIIFERLAAGNLRYLLSLDGAALDRTGNVECRALQILAGMIGDRPPQTALLEPSWHHIYAVVGWTDLAPLPARQPHYPATAPERSALAAAIFALIADGEARAAFRRDPGLFATRCGLAEDERAALAALDCAALRDRFQINPMLLYQLAQHLPPGG